MATPTFLHRISSEFTLMLARSSDKVDRWKEVPAKKTVPPFDVIHFF
jgi:hypothetical protein